MGLPRWLVRGASVIVVILSGLWLLAAWFYFGIQTDGGSDFGGDGCSAGYWDLLAFLIATLGAGTSILAMVGTAPDERQRWMAPVGLIGPFVGFALWLGVAMLQC